MNQAPITRYGVIADTHGNMQALEAVLAHAAAQKVEGYIFLGDYGGFGNTNQTVARLQNIKATLKKEDSFFIISGNGEEYIRDNYQAAFEKVFPKQWAPVQQECITIQPEKKEYLLGLPKIIKRNLQGSQFYMAHSPADIFGKSVLDFSSGRDYINLTENGKLKTSTYNQHMYSLVAEDASFLRQVSSFAEDVFLFGHYHTQWHAAIGGKLFVNPGSCGMPCDYDLRAPYTILEYDGSGWRALPQRVEYDVQKAIQQYKQTESYRRISIWSELYAKVVETGKNWPLLFLEHLDKVALATGATQTPYPDSIWEKAVQSWRWE